VLTREQEDELLDWVITKNNKAEAVNADEIIQYCDENFSWQPKRPWVSKFARRNRIASHLTQKKPAKRNRDTRIWTVDEFGIWDDDIRRRGYSHNNQRELLIPIYGILP